MHPGNQNRTDTIIFGVLVAALLATSVLSRSISVAFLVSKIVAVSMMGLYGLRHFLKPVRLNSVFYIYVIFMVWALLASFIMNAIMADALNQLSTMFQILVISILLYNVFQHEEDYLVISYIYLGVAFFLVAGQFLGITVTNSSYRFKGLTSNANTFGMYFNYASIALLYLISKREKKAGSQVLAIIALMGVAYFIFLSGSRKSQASLVAILFVYFLLNGLFKKNLLRIIILTAIPVFIFRDKILAIIYNSPLYFRISNQDYLERGVEIRIDNIAEGWRVFLENPIYGVGLDNFKYHNYSGLVAHNYYLEILSTTGVIGFMILGVLYLRIARYAWVVYLQKEYREEGVFALMFLTMNLVLSLGFHFHNAIEHWLFIAMMLPFLVHRQSRSKAAL